MNKEYRIAEGVIAFSTTRKGGVSQGNYSEFNINDFCGDCAEHVAENRRKLADELGISTDHIILPHQVHGVEVRQVAGVCVVPLQDYLCLGNEARMNTPSTLGDNWKWRLTRGQLTDEIIHRINAMTRLYGRIQENKK